MTNPDNRILSNYATFSQKTKGRMIFENHIDERTCFQRDRDRILHSAAFRRLKHKTQVFLNEQGDYYRTRLTHTIEVSQISRSISFALNLNEDLTEAIALSHDLGHPPFGRGQRPLKGGVPSSLGQWGPMASNLEVSWTLTLNIGIVVVGS